MQNLPKIQEGFRKWADEERAFWYDAGREARGTDREYGGDTWIGYYAFHEGKRNEHQRHTPRRGRRPASLPQ